MFTKKVILPAAALAMTALIGCGDDSSSSGPSDVVPASVKNFVDTGDITCSATVNKCAKVYVEELQDTMQCNGTAWEMMILAKPVTGCENAAPAAETPADPAAETPADPAAETPADPAAETPADPAAETPADPAAETPADPAAETPADPAAETPADPAAETPADPAAETPADPAAETPADPAAETPAGDMVSCDIPGALGECVEFPAGSAEAEAMKAQCVSVLEGTLGTGCAK